MINSRTHGAIDYIVGVVLILAPFLLGFADGTAAQYVPQSLGVILVLMSLLTAYELSLAKLIPYRVHLVADVIVGIVLLASPWLFGFADRIWWPHVLVGLIDIVVVGLSWPRGVGAQPSPPTNL